ncbi:fucose isomerase, partial [Candidatus Sumerlaeota bacterium]|nr:fucose isomerase [Candidatus Sumerlaeota bacterium]
VVKGLRSARIGAIGARPAAFNTVRCSEKILQNNGISVYTLDLSEVIGRAQKMADSDRRVRTRVARIKSYAAAPDVPHEAFVKMAKLDVVISDWMEQNDLHATAIQCWRSLQQNYGVSVCALMSMMSEGLMPSACEVDVTGALSMYALQLASGRPSALADWNNNYGDDPDKCVLFHCGNWPRAFLPDAQITTAETLGRVVGKSLTYGTMTGRTPACPMTFARIGTDDRNGTVHCYVGEGRFTGDPLETFGTKAVAEVADLQNLMQHICNSGFEHHVAVTASRVADILAESFKTYLGWDTYRHRG